MANKSNKYYSDIQESTIAEALGWKQVSGSGARSTYPGDVESDDWLGECKTHKDPGNLITFDFKVWKKIRDEAMSKFKCPALFVDDGSQSLNKTWVMFSSSPTDDVVRLSHSVDKLKKWQFDHYLMLDKMRKIVDIDHTIVIYSLDTSDKSLGTMFVSRFEDFKLIFEDY